MPEILSQQEIHTLLTDVSSGRTEPAESSDSRGSVPKQAIPFDFRLPHRLSKNQLRTFQAIHEDFCETFSSYLGSRLQTTVSITVAAVDQLFYSEFVSAIANPSCLYVFRIMQSDALAVLDVSPQLVLAIVEHLMGGVAEGEKQARPITRIEHSIVRGVIQRALADIQRAWKMVADLQFQLERYEIEADFVQIAPPSEIVMVVTLEVTIGPQKYLMNICFPTFALEDVLARLHTQQFGTAASASGEHEWRGPILRQISNTPVQAVAVLGETMLTVRELLHLEPGDILRTAIPLTCEVELRVGGRARVLGRPGISKGRVAIKVSQVLRDKSTGA